MAKVFVIWIIFGTPSQLLGENTVLIETDLLRVFIDLLTASDSGSISIPTLLDLSAAFDTIDHSILPTRLEKAFGICDLIRFLPA